MSDFSEAEITALERHCAWANSAVSELELDHYFKLAIKALQDSSVWREHENVRHWINNYWLSSPKVCH